MHNISHNNNHAFQIFQYYDAEGNSLGQTRGNLPDNQLFQSAHYVVSNQATMLKNKDSVEPVASFCSSCSGRQL